MGFITFELILGRNSNRKTIFWKWLSWNMQISELFLCYCVIEHFRIRMSKGKSHVPNLSGHHEFVAEEISLMHSNSISISPKRQK